MLMTRSKSCFCGYKLGRLVVVSYFPTSGLISLKHCKIVRKQGHVLQKRYLNCEFCPLVALQMKIYEIFG